MRVLLAVSGGIDSMYMLHRAPELFPGASFAVVHCNFGLRGEESDGDEAFVREACAALGVECFVKRFDTVGYASSHGVSVEMAARELRYAWFRELCAQYGFDTLATAHNANDNAETLILNLLRGTGTKGLRGIPTGTILRPLLETTREEIRSWMEANGHKWREDRTNAENGARRNKIRNQVFPVFGEINPSFVKTLGEDMARIRQTDDIAEDYYREAAERIVKASANSLEISVMPLLELKHWRYVLWRILEDCSFSAETFGKLCALLERYATEPSGTVTLSGKTFQSPTHILSARRKTLVLKERI
jgi:tRNA(Ile)-lysidine synthase